MTKKEKVIKFMKEEFGYTGAHIEHIEHIKPSHGPCCTCQVCGHPNDFDCVCENNRIHAFIQTL